MKNLVGQAAKWIQSDKYSSGNILERTISIIGCYRIYLEEEKDEIVQKTGLPFPLIMEKVVKSEEVIIQILSAFLGGNHQEALEMMRTFVQSMKMDILPPGMPLYKCRENSRLFHHPKEDMLHIPFNKRYLVGNQRYSLSGLPCLYLGSSSYICWEELGRKDFTTSNFCSYSLKEIFNVFDMVLPVEINNLHHIRRVLLILVCSLTAKRDSLFKPEYILSQCLLHSLIHKSYSDKKLFCIRYYSTHMLNGDADYFPCDYGSEACLARFVNYVFPALSSKCDGYCEELRSAFSQSETVSLLQETLLRPDRIMSGCNKDLYLNSQFGLMDAILDEKLGIVPKRIEGDVILASK